MSVQFEQVVIPLDDREWQLDFHQFGNLHWSGASLSRFLIRKSLPEYLAAIARYVTWLTPKDIADRKQLFAEYREAGEFRTSFWKWMDDHADRDRYAASIDIYIRDWDCNCFSVVSSQLTAAVPQAIRDRYAWTEHIAEQMNDLVTRVTFSLTEHEEKDVSGRMRTYYEFLLPGEQEHVCSYEKGCGRPKDC